MNKLNMQIGFPSIRSLRFWTGLLIITGAKKPCLRQSWIIFRERGSIIMLVRARGRDRIQ